jgi:hypothetical protein
VLTGFLHTRAELREVMMEDNGRDDGSGRLDAYLLYMLIALVAVIAAVTALA